MCVWYAIRLWMQHGGRFLFSFAPGFHVMVCSKDGIWHGTTRREDGKWHVEMLNHRAFAKWFAEIDK